MQESTPKAAEEGCEKRAERLGQLVRALAPKAAKWDALTLTCHRFGVKCQEIVRYINEKVQWK